MIALDPVIVTELLLGTKLSENCSVFSAMKSSRIKMFTQDLGAARLSTIFLFPIRTKSTPAASEEQIARHAYMCVCVWIMSS